MGPSVEAVDWLAGTVVSDGHTYRLPSSESAKSLEALNRHRLGTCVEKHFKSIGLENKIPYLLSSLRVNSAT